MGWAIGTRRFKRVVVGTKEHVAKGRAACKFSPLVGSDAAAVVVAVESEELVDDVNRWFFCSGEEDPYVMYLEASSTTRR